MTKFPKKKTGRKPSPGIQAAQYVAQENNTTLKIDHNTDGLIDPKKRPNKEHVFRNANTGAEEYIDTNRLERLMDCWIPWIKKQNYMCTLQDYWLEQGITPHRLKKILEFEPELEERYEEYTSFIGQLWSNLSSGKLEFKGDPFVLRMFAPRYVKEWREYNHEEKEFEAKIKKALEESNSLTPEQIIQISKVLYPKTEKPVDWRERDERVDSTGERPKDSEDIPPKTISK